MKLEYLKEICQKLEEWHSKDYLIGNISYKYTKATDIYDFYEVEYFCLAKRPGMLSGSSKSTFKFLTNPKEGSYLSSEL